MAKNDIIGLIPAAGKGSRLGLPFPKELYPTIVNNQYKPVAHYMVDYLNIAEVKHIVFVINETKQQLIEYFGSGENFDCHFSYVVQGKFSSKPSSSPGLANALASAYHLIQDKIVLFGMADTIIWPEDAFKKALENLNQDADIVLCLFPTKYPHKFGMVSFNDNNEVERIYDKPKKTNLTYMWGTIIWKPKFTNLLYSMVANDKSSDFAEIINTAIERGLSVKAEVFSKGNFIDFGTYEQIQSASSILQNNKVE